jgi:hypothetical protein
VLQELKLAHSPMTEHIYNELLRVYANACLKDSVPEAHIDLYVKDAFELFKTVERGDEPGVDVNIHLLNSLTFLFANALRPEQLEADVLPLYEKHRVKHDVYTYQHLVKMYLNMRDLDTIMGLWDKLMKNERFAPNQKVLEVVLEAALRLKNSDRIVEVLEEYVEQKKEPPRFLL